MPLSLLRGVFSFDEHDLMMGPVLLFRNRDLAAAIAAWHGFVYDPMDRDLMGSALLSLCLSRIGCDFITAFLAFDSFLHTLEAHVITDLIFDGGTTTARATGSSLTTTSDHLHFNCRGCHSFDYPYMDTLSQGSIDQNGSLMAAGMAPDEPSLRTQKHTFSRPADLQDEISIDNFAYALLPALFEEASPAWAPIIADRCNQQRYDA